MLGWETSSLGCTVLLQLLNSCVRSLVTSSPSAPLVLVPSFVLFSHVSAGVYSSVWGSLEVLAVYDLNSPRVRHRPAASEHSSSAEELRFKAETV